MFISMRLCTDLPNFIQIGRSATGLSRYVDFPRWQPYDGHTVPNLLPLAGFVMPHI